MTNNIAHNKCLKYADYTKKLRTDFLEVTNQSHLSPCSSFSTML